MTQSEIKIIDKCKQRESTEYDYAVYIGRFQPFHNGHLQCVTEALSIAYKLIIVIGSINQARSLRDPWTFEERKQLISGSLNKSQLSRVSIVGVEDSLYEPMQWETNIKRAVEQAQCQRSKIARNQEFRLVLIGHYRDHTSQYLKQFPEWNYVSVDDYQDIHATEIRNSWYGAILGDSRHKGMNKKVQGNRLQDWNNNSRSKLSPAVLKWMDDFAQTIDAQQLAAEAEIITNYKAQYSDLRWPVIHVTADSVVVKNDEVLMIKRSEYPGRGSWALPGGFVNIDERVEDAALRELGEETGIGLSPQELSRFRVATHVFDDPNRSSRGRTITHAGLFLLPNDLSLKLHAADDAIDVVWMTFNELENKRSLMFEDHFQIIHYFEQRYIKKPKIKGEKYISNSQAFYNNKQGGYCYE